MDWSIDTKTGPNLVAKLEKDAAVIAEHGGGPINDRIRTPAETVAALRPCLSRYGITRIARVTGLDRIGIPVFLAVRPNSRTLAVTQGKGFDDDAATASAVMESVEQAIAESPHRRPLEASPRALAKSGHAVVPPKRFLVRGNKEPASGDCLSWISGVELLSGNTAWAPLDVVRLDFTTSDAVHPFWQSSDGLASGNCLYEAVVHGICERIERDANALWTFRSDDFVRAHCIDPAALGDAIVDTLAAKIAAAGLKLTLFDITSDVGVPVSFAIIAERRPAAAEMRYFDVSRGTGCHPMPARAAIRAITEAAQSRLTAISGARDDFAPSEYQARLAQDLEIYLDAAPVQFTTEWSYPDQPGAYLGYLLSRLAAAGVRDVFAVPLSADADFVSVAKVIVPDLEDPPEAKHRKLGRRALKAMMAQQ